MAANRIGALAVVSASDHSKVTIKFTLIDIKKIKRVNNEQIQFPLLRDLFWSEESSFANTEISKFLDNLKIKNIRKKKNQITRVVWRKEEENVVFWTDSWITTIFLHNRKVHQ